MAFAQSKTVDWLSVKELEQRYYKEPKPVLIFLETDWCKVCKMQLHTPFQNDSVVNQLNKSFYSFKLNAEHKGSIRFFNRTYQYNNAERLNELGIYLGENNKRIEFPTTVILDNKLQPIFRKEALLSATELLELISTQIKAQ
jgi:uncharacterized protein YyaL (SSP411 family)